MKLNRERGFTLIEIVLVLTIGLAIIAGGVIYLSQASAQNRYQDRIRNTIAIVNEIKAMDPGQNTPIENLQVSMRNGQFGFIPKGMVEPYLQIAVHRDRVYGGGHAMVAYFNFQDQYEANCTRLQIGLTNNGTGLYVGTIPDIGMQGVVRCSRMTNGKTRGEVRIPYSGINMFMQTKIRNLPVDSD